MRPRLHSSFKKIIQFFENEIGGTQSRAEAELTLPTNPAIHLSCVATPLHLPHLIGAFQHYLWILKTCHAGADMDVALEMARGGLDGDLAWQLTDLLQNRNEWWVPGKIVELRQRLAGYWKVI